MAKLNTTFYQEEDGYSDGDLERELYERIEAGESPEKILESDTRWPVYYHLSPKRENILNWYPFEPESTVLEVGSGLGALTGMLCQACEKVTSVELTRDRAQVNYARNKDRDNLEIYVGNLENMDFDERFDYVVLNGVLEYAMSFTDSEHPFEDFLEKIRSFLKPGGTVLIAIENRIGLKYFNGVPEDHTAQLFTGIDGYPYTDNVKTFTKSELSALLKRSGLPEIKFYYPNPDYKFPQVIYSDDSLALVDNRVETDTFNVNRVRFFDESEVLRTFLEEGIADKFFNSFLVEAREKEREPGEEIVFAKISDRRRPAFQTMTKIVEKDGRRKVTKEALTPEGEEHIEQLKRYYRENPTYGRFTNVPLTETATGVAFDYVEGETLDKVLLNYLKNGERERFEEEIRSFAEELYDGTQVREDYCSDEFAEVFGPERIDIPLHVKSGSNMDLIFTNILRDDKDTIIDYEWTTDFPLPQEFVVWRSLYYLYNSELKGGAYDMEALMEIAGIDPSLNETFLKWDDYFGNTYITAATDDVYKNRTVDAVPFLTEMIGANDTASSLYLDYGEGFTEENRLLSRMEIDGDHFKVTFNLPEPEEGKRLQTIRWDPLETRCTLSQMQIDADAEIGIYPVEDDEKAAFDYDGVYYFLDDDPYLTLLGDYEGLTTVTISGKVDFVNTVEALEVAKRMQEEIRAGEEERKRQQEMLYDKNTHIHNLELLYKIKGEDS